MLCIQHVLYYNFGSNEQMEPKFLTMVIGDYHSNYNFYCFELFWENNYYLNFIFANLLHFQLLWFLEVSSIQNKKFEG